MTALAVPKKYDQDYLNKICGECGRQAKDGLYLDLDDPIRERKWKCKRCYRIKK
jgi:hypothetical protein